MNSYFHSTSSKNLLTVFPYTNTEQCAITIKTTRSVTKCLYKRQLPPKLAMKVKTTPMFFQINICTVKIPLLKKGQKEEQDTEPEVGKF